MDAATIRRALYDFYKFNPKDFRVQASGTGYLVGINKQRQATPNEYVGQRNMDGEPDVAANDFVDVEIPVPDLPGTPLGQTIAVNTGNQNNELCLIGQWVGVEMVTLRFWNRSASSPNGFAPTDIYVRVFVPA